MKGLNNQQKNQVGKNENSIIIELLGEKAIAFNPMLGRLANSATAGLFLSQLLYWYGKGSDPNWIYKTIDEMHKESCLTRSEQDRAIKIWVRFNVLKVELRSIPRKRYFHLNEEALVNLIKSFSGKDIRFLATKFAESDKLAGKLQQTNYTENTQKKTSREGFFKKNQVDSIHNFQAERSNFAKKLSTNSSVQTETTSELLKKYRPKFRNNSP